ncbi:hypothetical protein SAMN05444412_102409 [Rhodonellum ikkaensis]|uniref:Uncharacterized protein n=1 Tax=Rhodonellum ikkaensis TaxID=336829 RepID=A0A1H3MB52_9BACT|nr:hypothetical protein SAMN05444412_102409 [Rhodonellum ikkaensis]
MIWEEVLFMICNTWIGEGLVFGIKKLRKNPEAILRSTSGSNLPFAFPRHKYHFFCFEKFFLKIILQMVIDIGHL